MATEKALAITSGHAVMQISAEEIRQLLIPANVPQPTDQEIALFIRVCQETELNPFLKQIYLVKASDSMPAAIIPSTQSWEARADRFPMYDGYEAGLLIYQDGKFNERPGSLVLPGEIMGKQVVGGYARIYRKDRSKAFYLAVTYTESVVSTKDGAPNRFWAKQPAYQLRLSALRKALKEAFPNDYPDSLFNEEQINNWDENTGEYSPVAFQGKKEVRWDAFWAKLKDIGIDHNKAQEILDCASIKVWVNAHSLEDAYNKIMEYVQKNKIAKDKEDLFGDQMGIQGQPPKTVKEQEKPVDLNVQAPTIVKETSEKPPMVESPSPEGEKPASKDPGIIPMPKFAHFIEFSNYVLKVYGISRPEMCLAAGVKGVEAFHDMQTAWDVVMRLVLARKKG